MRSGIFDSDWSVMENADEYYEKIATQICI